MAIAAEFQSQTRRQPCGDQNITMPRTITTWFQSQTRRQPCGDGQVRRAGQLFQSVSISNETPALWRRPRAGCRTASILVSISNETPALWRPIDGKVVQDGRACFNLKRDASPVATSSVWSQQGAASGVAMSNETPALWRLSITVRSLPVYLRFNLKRDASPVATQMNSPVAAPYPGFQSQTRRQPCGDASACTLAAA